MVVLWSGKLPKLAYNSQAKTVSGKVTGNLNTKILIHSYYVCTTSKPKQIRVARVNHWFYQESRCAKRSVNKLCWRSLRVHAVIAGVAAYLLKQDYITLFTIHTSFVSQNTHRTKFMGIFGTYAQLLVRKRNEINHRDCLFYGMAAAKGTEDNWKNHLT